MDYRLWSLHRLWTIFMSIHLVNACYFYSKLGQDSEAEGVRFIRVREDMNVGSDILTLRAYPRDSIKIKGIDRSSDYKFFKLLEINNTFVQVLLDKTLEDLVDRDVPQNLLKFKIECSSRDGRNEEASSLAITVYIEDINDHFPKFKNLPYKINVDESTPVGSTVFQGISAFDRDKPNTPNSDVQYSIGLQDYGPGGPYFSLESPHRPAVVLRRPLDYDEGIQQFLIPIIASDRGTPPKISNTNLTIYIDDSDDQPPRFTEGVYRTTINEFYPLTGKHIRKILRFKPEIKAFDQDSINSTLIYDIISGNERSLFTVNPTSGDIFLERKIDLEEESLPGNTFVLQLEARQQDNALKRAVARVEIEIIDLNDNAPEFEVDLYNISIVENLPSGFSVLQVNAIDRDQGENAEFYYQINDENPAGAFVIDPRTGWITVRDQELLDKEARPNILMSVQALEKKEPYDRRDYNAGTVNVEITLLDSNDNTPEFEMGNLYEFKCNIDAPVGHIVGYVTATDPDEGRNGMILYELQHPRGSGVVPFKLDSNSGAIIVSGPLRRGRIAVFVEASDQPANPSERRFSLAVVTIEVVAEISTGAVDFIGAPYEFWVGADVPIGSSVGQIRTNLDFEGQSEVMYDLLHSYSEGVPFAVEERSGIVTVIRDFADFDRVHYEFEAVAAHEAVDKPYGKLIRRNSKSERQITKNGEVFEIDEGVISDSQNVLVTNVTIHIVNPDDERGILMRGTYADPIEFHIKENLSGALIGQLLYQNATIKQLDKPQGKSLQTNTTTTTTTATKTADEPREMYSAKSVRKDRQLVQKNPRNITAKAKKKYTRKNRDTDLSTFYVSVTPTVYFDDVLFGEEAHPFVSIAEPLTAPMPQPLKGKNAKIKELETGAHIEYSRKSSYDTRINAKDRPINFETFASTKFVNPIANDDIPNDSTIRSETPQQSLDSDNVPSGPVEVVITPKPRIAKQRNLFVLKPNATGSSTQKIEKRSHAPNSNLRFFIANQQDVTDMISITDDGTLMTVKALDREVRDLYRLTVIAEYSKGYVNGAGIYQVIIHVDDVNDNPPVFNQKSYSGIILENSPMGSDVYVINQQIFIHDADKGINSDFSVTLSGDGSNLFKVELVNGSLPNNHTLQSFAKCPNNMNIAESFAKLQIMLMDIKTQPMNEPYYAVRFVGPRVLDRERESFYDLKILAKDRGGLSSEVPLNIYVADVNDNAPTFDKVAVFKDVGIEVLESTNDLEIYFVDRFGSDLNAIHDLGISPVKHNDSDKITYGISLANREIMQIGERVAIGTPRGFNINNDHGSIRIRKSKQYETPYPLFSLSEKIPVGSVILKISATDEDYDENAQIFYEIVSETFLPKRVTPRHVHIMKYLGIDRLSGEIKTNRQLPAESEIRLNISAKDIGGLTDYTTLKFKVIDVNDHAPVFEKSWYTFDVNEGVYAGSVLGKIVATDEDYGSNANITYSIEGEKALPFFVTQYSGVLKINGELDRETKSNYEFKILATDNSEREVKLSSYAEIEVNVLDLNDNSPEFTGYDEIYYARSIADFGGNERKFINGDGITSDNNLQDVSNQQNIPVYKAYLKKSTEPGTFVKQIAAIDKDFAGNGNGLVMYALHHNQLPYFFEIDSRDGIITTVSKFTRFHGYEHLNLTIIASDLGSPSRTSSALLLVNLQGADVYDDDSDEDRNFPEKYYEIEVVENSEAPLELIQLNATAHEEHYKWSIVPEMEVLVYDEFEIDSRNGTLWLTKPLDRETKDSYSLKIRADKVMREAKSMPTITYPISDEKVQGLLDNEVRIIIKVIDENDHEPKFIGNGKPIIAVMPNSANFGFPVTRVHATDQDVGLNADVRYTLLNEPSKLFGIDAISGRIRVLGPIRNDQRVYGFDVKATDRQGADDGRSSIANVFVYVLDDHRQVRLVIAGDPVDVEKEIDTLTRMLSDATELDIRVRMLEPHVGSVDPATDVFIYAVDPRSNSIIDMDDLQSTMSTVAMQNLTTSAHILELSQIGSHNFRNINTIHNATLKTPELASIILAVVVFCGGLATALCVVCVRNKRRNRLNAPRQQLAYSISGTPSTVRTTSKSSGSTKQMLPSTRTISSQLIYRDSKKHITKDRHAERPREYIDVPLPQSVLNYNLDHESSCLRYNQIHPQNLDTSVPSLHSSGRDSGLDLSRERSESPSKQIVRIIRDSRGRNGSKRKKCACGHNEQHRCSGDDSSDSYEDSLKNSKVCRRTSLPKNSVFRRSMQINPVGSRGMRHSFSGIRDDLVQGSPGLLQHHRMDITRTSVSDLEERLRNLERSFREPFHLNNYSRC